jgi:hypothetical protein
MEVDPSGLEWTQKQLLDNLKKCDGGTDIYAKAKAANGDKNPTIVAGDSTDVDLTNGTITIKKNLDVCFATQYLIYELTNLSLKKEFLEVDAACKAGNLSRAQYIYDTERIEYLGGSQNVIKAFKSCQKAWGCENSVCVYFPTQPPPGKSYEENFGFVFYELITEEHKEYYGKMWDKRCQAAFDKKPGHAKGPGRPGRP